MPVTLAQFDAAHAHSTAAEAFGVPQRPLPKEKILEMLGVSTAIAHCWIAEEQGVHPLFQDASQRVRGLAEQLLERDNKIRNTIAENPYKSSPWGGREKDDKSFLGTFNGGFAQRHNTRLLIMLLFDEEASAEAFGYIDEVVKKALHSAATPAAVPWRLLVGWRDFHAEGVSAWVRAKTLLLAHNYELAIHHAAAQRGINSMGHAPSLTARQTRRTGVAQAELRRRWA
ncbi:hypothetical protein BCR35DRAFT_332656 [Leucosporidium creatinivorum]|uniref:Uncharacterized protein n=1 Tax=Leucosporidium creatinivorum TaxID=106004 RepID=A0A1Y2F075_9BASI|nr:hypothetical protein BCR35DRAFT_332656 [Leucosporidium creatinivorum]